MTKMGDDAGAKKDGCGRGCIFTLTGMIIILVIWGHFSKKPEPKAVPSSTGFGAKPKLVGNSFPAGEVFLQDAAVRAWGDVKLIDTLCSGIYQHTSLGWMVPCICEVNSPQGEKVIEVYWFVYRDGKVVRADKGNKHKRKNLKAF